ncbi:MAG: HAD hydrolase family protein [Acidobacteriota bacterium]
MARRPGERRPDGRAPSLAALLKSVRILFLDVDGVLTDGSIILLPGGDEQKIFDVKDGTGIVWASWIGLRVALVTGRKSLALEERARELRILHLRQKAVDKVAAAREILEECHLDFSQAAAMGDDYGDLALLRRVALPTCPADAHTDLRRECLWQSRYPGGHGAVRELVEKIIRARKLMPEILRKYGLRQMQPRSA